MAVFLLNATRPSPGSTPLLQIDEDGSKQIEYNEFLHAIRLNKALSKKQTAEQDTIDAFAALGGNVSTSAWAGPPLWWME